METSELAESSDLSREPQRAAWLALLDELERSLGEAALGTSGVDLNPAGEGWSPPAGIGPLPADLVDRAQDILGGQRELISELEGERKVVGEKLAALRQVPSAQVRAVYLDISG